MGIKDIMSEIDDLRNLSTDDLSKLSFNDIENLSDFGNLSLSGVNDAFEDDKIKSLKDINFGDLKNLSLDDLNKYKDLLDLPDSMGSNAVKGILGALLLGKGGSGGSTNEYLQAVLNDMGYDFDLSKISDYRELYEQKSKEISNIYSKSKDAINTLREIQASELWDKVKTGYKVTDENLLMEDQKMNMKTDVEIDFDIAMLHDDALSEASLAAVSDIKLWAYDLISNPMEVICCFIKFFVSISVSIPGLKLIYSLLPLLKTIEATAEVEPPSIMEIFKETFNIAFTYSLKAIIDAIKKFIIGLIDKLEDLAKSYRVLYECLHLGVLFQILRDFINKLLKMHFEINLSSQLSIEKMFLIKNKAKGSFISDWIQGISNFFKSLLGAIISAPALIEKFDICDVIEFKDGGPIFDLMVNAYAEVDLPESEWWGDTISTEQNDYRVPSDRLVISIIDAMSKSQTSTSTIPLFSEMDPSYLESRSSSLGVGDGNKASLSELYLRYISKENECGCYDANSIENLIREFDATL